MTAGPDAGRDATVFNFRTVTLGSMGFVTLLAGAQPAAAQMYSWRTPDGTLVVSDRPSHPDARAYPIYHAAEVATTRPPAPGHERYSDLIERHARRYGVSADLVRAVIQVESAFDPTATSHKGAMGLMQLMPATATGLGIVDPYDPDQNIRGGVAYLRQLLDRYGGREALALAAYNAGPTAVDRHGSTVPPYRETQNYVTKVTDLTNGPALIPRHVIYKTTEIINGRLVPRYSDAKPATDHFETIPID